MEISSGVRLNDSTHEELPLINAAEQTGINDNETISIRFNFTYKVTVQRFVPISGPIFDAAVALRVLSAEFRKFRALSRQLSS